MINCVEAHNKRDYAAAAPYCRAAADRGNSQAQRMLAGLYKMGSGVPMNQARARALYDQACNGGDRHGCFYLAVRRARRRPARAAPTSSGAVDAVPRRLPRRFIQKSRIGFLLMPWPSARAGGRRRCPSAPRGRGAPA
jgi:TPR repeat protein